MSCTCGYMFTRRVSGPIVIRSGNVTLARGAAITASSSWGTAARARGAGRARAAAGSPRAAGRAARTTARTIARWRPASGSTSCCSLSRRSSCSCPPFSLCRLRHCKYGVLINFVYGIQTI